MAQKKIHYDDGKHQPQIARSWGIIALSKEMLRQPRPDTFLGRPNHALIPQVDGLEVINPGNVRS